MENDGKYPPVPKGYKDQIICSMKHMVLQEKVL